MPNGAVSFIIPLTWLCFSLFLIFQTQILIIHFINIHYSASSPKPLDLMFSLIKFTVTYTRIENVNETVPTSVSNCLQLLTDQLIITTHCKIPKKKKPSDSDKIQTFSFLREASLNPNAPCYEKTDKVQITTEKRLRRVHFHPKGSFTSYAGCCNENITLK